MSANGSSDFRRHNVMATFKDEGQAVSIKKQLVDEGVSEAQIVVKPRDDETAIEYAEMRDELEGVAASPGIGAGMTKSQSKGSFIGVVLFTVIGLVLGLLAGLLMGGERSTFIMTTVAFGVGGATFGFVAGGFLKPRLRPDDKDKGDSQDRPLGPESAPAPGGRLFVLDFRTDKDEEAERVLLLLKGAQPERLDQFDSEGRVVNTLEVGAGRSDTGS